MQVANANPHVTVTGRHVTITAAINDYAQRRVENLHLDYPKIIDAHVILDVEKFRHRAEVVLNCSNHITIGASEECPDLYASIDGVIAKIARRMRKYKTRLLRSHRPRRYDRVGSLEEQVLPADAFAALDGQLEEIFSPKTNGDGTEPAAGAREVSPAAAAAPAEAAPATQSIARGGGPRPAVRTEPYPLKPMFVDEAVLQLQMSEEQPFLVFHNATTDKVNVLYRRKGGEFGLIQPTAS